MVGWELGPAIVDLAGRHFGVDELERADALGGGVTRSPCARETPSPSMDSSSVFDENSIVACLRERETWEALVKK